MTVLPVFFVFYHLILQLVQRSFFSSGHFCSFLWSLARPQHQILELCRACLFRALVFYHRTEPAFYKALVEPFRIFSACRHYLHSVKSGMTGRCPTSLIGLLRTFPPASILHSVPIMTGGVCQFRKYLVRFCSILSSAPFSSASSFSALL